VRGKVHDYLGMILDFTDNGAMKVDMVYYIKGTFEEFPYKIGPTKATPWTEKLLKINHSAPKLEEEQRKTFHRFVMKYMFLCKRARPDIDQGVSFLSSRVKDANAGDWTKLLRVLQVLDRISGSPMR
jgi:hypothetical protein